MAYKAIRAADVDLDRELIFDFLVAATEEFGESEEAAFLLAEQGIAQIEAAYCVIRLRFRFLPKLCRFASSSAGGPQYN